MMASDDLLCRLGERRPDKLVTAEARREDEPLAHPPPLAVGDQSEPAEVDLELDPWRQVVDANRDGASPGPATFNRKAGHGPVRDHHATAGQQDADFHHGEVLLDPGGDLGLLGEQCPPCLAVAVDAVRTHPLEHLADQLVG